MLDPIVRASLVDTRRDLRGMKHSSAALEVGPNLERRDGSTGLDGGRRGSRILFLGWKEVAGDSIEQFVPS